MFNNSWVIHINKVQQWVNIFQRELKSAENAYALMDHSYTPGFDEYPILIKSMNPIQQRWSNVGSVKKILESMQKCLETLHKMSRNEQISLEEYDFLKRSPPFNRDSAVLNYPKDLIVDAQETPVDHKAFTLAV